MNATFLNFENSETSQTPRLLINLANKKTPRLLINLVNKINLKEK